MKPSFQTECNVMKRLYIVKDIPRWIDDISCYTFVVRASDELEAIQIVKKHTKNSFRWEAELADNDIILE